MATFLVASAALSWEAVNRAHFFGILNNYYRERHNGPTTPPVQIVFPLKDKKRIKKDI